MVFGNMDLQRSHKMKFLSIALVGFAIAGASAPLAAAAQDVSAYKGNGGVVRMTNNQAGTNAQHHSLPGADHRASPIHHFWPRAGSH